jgi:hypothetical protein
MTPDNAVQLVRELGERASPRPWGPITGPSDGKQKAIDDGGDFGILHPDLRAGMIMMEAFRCVQSDTDFPAEANAAYTALAVNNFEAVVGALRATGHRPYRKNTTHWHEPNESGYCPGCAALAAVAEAAKKALA